MSVAVARLEISHDVALRIDFRKRGEYRAGGIKGGESARALEIPVEEAGVILVYAHDRAFRVAAQK